MAAPGNFTPISLYYSTTTGHVPAAANLILGELAINVTDGFLYYKDNSGNIQNIGGARANGAIYENAQSITTNYTMTTNYNGESVGPITIGAGVSVTIPSGSRWLVF